MSSRPRTTTEPAATMPDQTETSGEAVDTILPSGAGQPAQPGSEGGASVSPQPETVPLAPMTPEAEPAEPAAAGASAGAPAERSWVDRLFRRIGW